MNIGEAINALEQGKKVKDPRWEKGQFVHLSKDQILRHYPDSDRDYAWCPTNKDLLKEDYEEA